MELSSKKAIKNLLKKYFTRPVKRLGQHFLIDKKVFRKIIRAANLKSEDICLEIGPGIGNLTQELAKRAKRVIAVEKDPNLTRILNEELRIKKIKNVEVIQGDILKINPKSYKLKVKGYKVVANLPYYIVFPVIRKFLELSEIVTRGADESRGGRREGWSPKVLVLMVQKEVAERICAKPPDMNLLAVSVQFYSKPEIVSHVSKKSFWPQPKVDSAIIKITPKKILLRSDLHNLFFKVVKAGFSQPRKQLINNLSRLRQGFGGQAKKIDREKIKNWLLKNKIQPTQRAETLSLQDWLKLTQNFSSSLD